MNTIITPILVGIFVSALTRRLLRRRMPALDLDGILSGVGRPSDAVEV